MFEVFFSWKHRTFANPRFLLLLLLLLLVGLQISGCLFVKTTTYVGANFILVFWWLTQPWENQVGKYVYCVIYCLFSMKGNTLLMNEFSQKKKTTGFQCVFWAGPQR